MTDKLDERDAQNQHKACPAAIGPRALAAAVLYAPANENDRETKRTVERPVPPDTD